MANNCKQCSIRIISHTTTPLPKAYDCVAVYIAGRRTSLVVYGWWPQPPTKNEDPSHQRHKIRNCHWNLFLHSPSYISHFVVTNTIMAHEIDFFQSYFISDLYLIYILNDFKKSNVCLFYYNSFLYKETVKHSIVCSYGLQWWCKSLYIK